MDKLNGTVFIVDDAESSQLLLANRLKNHYNLIQESNSRIALERIPECMPDLILLDIAMPEMDGYEVCETLKANPKTRDIPVIFLTSTSDKEGVVKCFKSGGEDYLAKPFNVGELLARVQTHIELKQYKEILKKQNEKLLLERGMLMSYFSEDIADMIVQGGLEDSMSGKMLPVTTLFADIRNFTSISEKIDPHRLVDVLNAIFKEVMDTVFRNKGSVNKLMGDAVLATFGAPVAAENDAANAVRCALEIQELLIRFNEVRPDYLAEEIKMGIGIATGVVFAGNIGSSRRKEYTVIGDAVNIASRLETLTKSVEANLLLDEATREKLGDEFVTSFVVKGRLKGKSQTINIYTASQISPENNNY